MSKSEHVPSFTMVLPLPNSFLDLQFIRSDIELNPTMLTHPVGYSMEIDKIGIDDEVFAVQSPMMWHLSSSNIDYRLFFTPDSDDSLDGIIVRYQQNSLIEGVNDEEQIFELVEGDENDLAGEIDSVFTKNIGNSVWIPIPVPDAQFALGEGLWDITVTAYSIGNPADRREA